MRDALALGYGQPATETFLIPVPVFIGADSLAALLQRNIFTSGGRFFPCAEADSCDAQDLYLENPRISVLGGAVVLDAHLSGHYRWLFFNPGLTGDIRLAAKPSIQGTVVRLENPTLEVVSRNAIVKYYSRKVAARVVDRVASTQLEVSDALAAATDTVKKRFPIRWGPACLLLDVDHVNLRSFEVKSNPPGLVMNFGVEIRTATGDQCNAP
jgi:hypothetical protein